MPTFLLRPSQPQSTWLGAFRHNYFAKYLASYRRIPLYDRFVKTLNPERMQPLRQKPIRLAGLTKARVFLSPRPLLPQILALDTFPEDRRDVFPQCSLTYYFSSLPSRSWTFPDDADGYFYLRVPTPPEPLHLAEIRFRIVPSTPTAPGPDSFLTQFWDHGRDLLLPAPRSPDDKHPSSPLLRPLGTVPWALPILRCRKPNLRPFWEQIVNEELIDKDMLSAIDGYPTRDHSRRITGPKPSIFYDPKDAVTVAFGHERRLGLFDKTNHQQGIYREIRIPLFTTSNWRGRIDLRFQLSKDPAHVEKDVLVFEVVSVDPALECRTRRKYNYLKPVPGQLLMWDHGDGNSSPAQIDLDNDSDLLSEDARNALKSLVQAERERLRFEAAGSA